MDSNIKEPFEGFRVESSSAKKSAFEIEWNSPNKKSGAEKKKSSAGKKQSGASKTKKGAVKKQSGAGKKKNIAGKKKSSAGTSTDFDSPGQSASAEPEGEMWVQV